MGCFNRQGFYSNLPILYGQDSFLLIVLENKEKSIITPIAPPVFGKYDDYGKLDNIEQRSYYKAVTDLLMPGEDIEKLIYLIDDCEQKRFNNSIPEDYENLMGIILGEYKKICPYSVIEKDSLNIRIILDHRCVWDHFVEMYSRIFSDLITDYEENVKPDIEEKIKISEQNLKNCSGDKKYIYQGSIEMYTQELIERSYDMELMLKEIGNRAFQKINRFGTGPFESEILTLGINDRNNFVIQSPLEFLDYAKFLSSFGIQSCQFSISRLGSQSSCYMLHKELMQKYIGIMDEEIDQYEEDGEDYII